MPPAPPEVLEWLYTAGAGGGVAQGPGVGLFASGGAYWPLATAHSDPLWVRTCFGCVNGAQEQGWGVPPPPVSRPK